MTSYADIPNSIRTERNRLQPYQATLPALHNRRRRLVVPALLPPPRLRKGRLRHDHGKQ